MADAETPTPTDAPPKAGLKAKLPLILGIIVGLGVGAGTGAVVVGPATARTMGYTLPDSVVAALNAVAKSKTADGEHAEDGEHAAEEGEHAEGEGGEGAEGGAAAPAVVTLENLVLNPAGSGGARFLLLTVAMECKDAATVTMLQSRDAELRDVVLSSLGLKTVEQLAEIGAREQIKVDLTTALNERFGKKTVVRVYFPQFVVQ